VLKTTSATRSPVAPGYYAVAATTATTGTVYLRALRNEAEARLLEATLFERGIPHFLKSYHDPAYDGIWQAQLGWGHVEAPSEYREQIETIYDDLTGSGE